MQLNYTDRIEVSVTTNSSELRQAAEENREFIGQETLANSIGFELLRGAEAAEVEVGGYQASLAIQPVG